MRRTQFITAALVAIITFFSLQAFVGERYPGFRGGWHGGHWYGHHGYYSPFYDSPGYNDPDRRPDRRNEPPPPDRGDTAARRY